MPILLSKGQTQALLKFYFLLRQSRLLICSFSQLPIASGAPGLEYLSEGDLHHHGFLLKKQPNKQTCGELEGQEAGQGLLVVHLPDVKAQRQKVIVSNGLILWHCKGSHVVDTTGPLLPRPHRAVGQNGRENLSNSSRRAKQSSSCALFNFSS